MPLHRLAYALTASALVAAAVPAVASTVAAPAVTWDALPASYGIVSHGSTSTFTRTGIAGLDKATNLGPASGPMTVDLVIEHPHWTQEHAFAESIYDVKSANYHHYLTPATYAARFGVPASATKAAQSWLTKGGLTLVESTGSGDIVQAKGSVAQVSKLFSTSISRFSDGHASYLANTVAPVVPTSLHVSQVIGLNTKQQATVDTVPSAVKPAVLGLTADGPWDPNTMAHIYDQPTTNTGQGQTAGVFISGQMAPIISDLRVYEDEYKLGHHPVRTVFEGTPNPTQTNYGGDEWNLDTSAIVGMAPGIREMDYYDAASLYDVDLLPDFAHWRDDPAGPQQTDASFGECEQNPGYPILGQPTVSSLFFNGLGNNTEPAYEMVLQAAAMEGRTLFASAGDTGGACPAVLLPGIGAVNGAENAGVPLQNYPAASPWAVSVGGTDIEATDDTKSTRAVEYAEPTGGGGPSVFLAAQPWQLSTFADTARSPQAVPDPCAVDESGNAYPVGTECRGTPDLAALYGGQTGEGYESEEYHYTEPVGGTSLSSPLNVGMWTRIQAAAPTKAGLGFAPPSLYKAFQDNANTFYDVTVGSNGQRTAGPGYDYVTGLGVPDGVNMMKDLTGLVTPSFPQAIPAVAAPTTNACVPVFTTFTGNASDPLNPTSAVPGTPPVQDAALDIASGDLKLSADGKSLIVTLAGPTLSPHLPANLAGNGADFDMVWLYKGKKYVARANVAAGSGQINYEAGPFSGAVPAGSTGTADTAVFDDATQIDGSFGEGKLTMTVPLTLVGSPKKGELLQYPLAFDESAELGPAFLPLTIDAGADQDYVLGSACDKLGASASAGAKLLTIRRSKAAVRYGQHLTLSGALNAGGAVLPKVTLVLKGRTDDSKTKTLKTLTTDANGRWSYTFTPSRDEVYSITGSGLTAKLVKTPTTLSFPQLRGVAKRGVLSVSGSVSPGYKLSSKQHETVYVYRLNKQFKPVKLLGKVNADQLSSRKGSPLGVNRFSLVTKVPKGTYVVGIAVSNMPLNAGAVAARFRVKV